jgi:hypothetical protein
VSDQTKVAAGIAALVAAVVIAFVVVSDSNDDPGQGDSGGGGGKLACTLAGSGVALLAEGLSRGRSAGAIVATIGGPATGFACNEAIKALVNRPDQPVELNIEQPAGPTVSELITGSQLAQPPPSPPSGVPRAIDCLGWNSAFLYRLCVDGTLEPPPR